MKRNSEGLCLQVESLEPRMMLSTVQIIAAGSENTEVMNLQIDGQTVQSWSNIGGDAFAGQFQTYTWSTGASISADQVRIQFTNDVYDPANGIDTNLRVDAIVIDGVRYETEASSIFSTGTWLAEDGIQPGFGRGEFLHSDGYFQFSADSPSLPEDGGDGLYAEYYDNIDFTDLFRTGVDPQVNFNFGSGAPEGMGVDTFSIRWTGQIETLYSEEYTFHTTSDDGVRLWVDGQLIIDNWTNHGATVNTGTISLQAGRRYDIRMEYYENGGNSVAQLRWSSDSQQLEAIPQSQLYSSRDPGLGDGLNAEYYDNIDFTDLFRTGVDPQVNFNFGRSAPEGMGVDTFSIRWTGQVQPLYTNEYTFHTTSDDGVRLWVDGKLIIDNWTNHGATVNTGTIALQAGRLYDIRMEYYENGGGSVAQLRWSSDSQPLEVIPQSQLYSLSKYSRGQSDYFQTPTTMTWQEAQDFAQRIGGNLVTINSATEEAWIRETFGTSQRFWTGFNDLVSEGDFVWASGEASEYTNFHPNEPNNSGGNQDGVVINFSSSRQWDDETVTKNFFGIIEVKQTETPASARASTYYVSTNGSDSHTVEEAQTENTAWRSIQRAVEVAEAGDTIIVAEGTYSEEVYLNNSGEKGKDIVLRAASQHGVRLHGFIHGRDVSHITVEGFDVTNRLGGLITEGIVFYDSHHITIRNNLARNSFGGGIQFNQSDWLLIEGNITHGNSGFNRFRHSGISIYQARDLDSDDREWGIVIRDNISYNNRNFFGGSVGRNPTDGNGIVLDDFKNQQRGADGVAYSRSTLVENNLTYANGGHGIHLFLAVNAVVRNNTSVGNSTTLNNAGNLSVGASDNVRAYNNVISGVPLQRAVRTHGNVNFIADSNILNGPTNSFEGSGNLLVVPEFEGDSYRLKPGIRQAHWGSNLVHQPVDRSEFEAALLTSSFEARYVPNGDLETTRHADGQSSAGAAGWEFSDAGGDWNPTNQFATGEIEGENVGYLNSGTAIKDLDERYNSANSYYLKVDLGARFNQEQAGFEISVKAGETVLGRRAATVSGNGRMETVYLLVVDGARQDLDGQNLSVEIRNTGGGQLNFDRVRFFSLPGTVLSEVSVGSDGTTWAVGQYDSLWMRRGSTWERMPGSLNQISVGSANNIWGVDASNEIYQWDGEQWTLKSSDTMAGLPVQVSVGADGTVWAIDAMRQIYQLSGNNWQRVSGSLVQVSVGDASNIWGVNRSNSVYQRNGTGWSQVNVDAITSPVVQVEAASDGTVWAIAEDDSIWQRTENSWSRVGGALANISVGSSTHIWGTNSGNSVYQRTTNNWTRQVTDLNV